MSLGLFQNRISHGDLPVSPSSKYYLPGWVVGPCVLISCHNVFQGNGILKMLPRNFSTGKIPCWGNTKVFWLKTAGWVRVRGLIKLYIVARPTRIINDRNCFATMSVGWHSCAQSFHPQEETYSQLNWIDGTGFYDWQKTSFPNAFGLTRLQVWTQSFHTWTS